MAHELSRLIAACEPIVFKQLLMEYRPNKIGDIDWALSGRDLGRHAEDQLGVDGKLSLLFEQIEQKCQR